MILCIADDSSPVSRLELVLGFIRTGIEPIFGILMILALKVLDLSLKSHINDPVLESFFWNTGHLNFTRYFDQDRMITEHCESNYQTRINL